MKENFKESKPAPHEGPKTPPAEFTKKKLATAEEMRVGYGAKPLGIKEDTDDRTA
jgi:hypothetical protein